MIWIGIDYSLLCPAVCVLDQNDPRFQASRIYYLTQIRRVAKSFGNIHGSFHEDYNTEIQRYEIISNWVLRCIQPVQEPVHVWIEDYSLGSRGRIFNLAEHTGILKYKLYQQGITFETVPPTVVKKFFSGKGNADKLKMYEAFENKTGIDLFTLISPNNRSTQVGSPISDIVDSYAIALYGNDKH